MQAMLVVRAPVAHRAVTLRDCALQPLLVHPRRCAAASPRGNARRQRARAASYSAAAAQPPEDALRSEPAAVLGTQRRSGDARGTQSVTYVEGDDGRLLALTSADVRSSAQRIRGFVAGLLLPQGGVSVSAGYWSFSLFYFIRTLFSACSAVLGTRALLRSIGVGGAVSTAGSALLNWVLKDGLGRCGAIVAASTIGNRFDNDSKTFSLVGDMTYELGVGIELSAPLFPSAFLFIGSIANALKSTSYMMRLPPRAAFLKSFSKNENVGDLSAKANAQEVVAGMLGMMLGIALSSAIGDSCTAAYCIYTCTLATVTACSYASLRGLRLPTLNWARMRILLRLYVQKNSGAVPGLREVNALEPMPSWVHNWRSSGDRRVRACLRASHLWLLTFLILHARVQDVACAIRGTAQRHRAHCRRAAPPRRVVWPRVPAVHQPRHCSSCDQHQRLRQRKGFRRAAGHAAGGAPAGAAATGARRWCWRHRCRRFGR